MHTRAAASHVERALVLRTFEPFRALSSAELVVIAEQAVPHMFRRGSLLYRPNSVVHSLHFVTSGKIGIERGRELVRTLGPQSVVGGMASMIGEPDARVYRALEDSTTLQLDREDMEEVFDEHFAIFLGVVRAIARGLIQVRSRLGPQAGFPSTLRGTPMREFGELGLVEKVFVLRNTLDFAKARVEALADLAQETEEVLHPSGATLWKVGDPSDHALMLMSGVVRCQTADGSQNFGLDPGSTVGGIDSLADEPRWFGAVAETDVRALRVGIEQLLDVIEDNIDMGIQLLRVLAIGLDQLQMLLEDKGQAPVDPAAGNETSARVRRAAQSDSR